MDEKDREACQAVYEQARSSVAGGIHYLLSARQHDPYGDGTKRILYETVMRTGVSEMRLRSLGGQMYVYSRSRGTQKNVYVVSRLNIVHIYSDRVPGWAE